MIFQTVCMSNGSQFYVDRALELVVDPLGPPVVQNQLLEELKKCDDLVQLDWRYAQMVAGASKMPMNMIWVARNQDEPVSDTDLAALKDIAWSEIVKKRYLASIPGTSTVSDTASSMLEIVREMNLQRRRFQIMGLHEQVEASEIHLVLHLCQAGLIRTDKYRTTANRFRRHDKLFEAFGLAVGAFVCASAPFTLGAATTRYERDLQYEYKKNATALFVYVLQQNMGGMNAVGLEEDYVARIARLIVVWPDDEGGGGKRRIGFKRPGKKGGGGGDDDEDGGGGGKDLNSMVLDSVAVAQDCAEKAHLNVLKLRGEFDTKTAVWEEKIAGEKVEFGREMTDRIAEAEQKIRVDVMQAHKDFEQELRFKHEINHSTLASTLTDVRSEIKTLKHRVETLSVLPGGSAEASMTVDAGKIDELEARINRIGATVDGLKEGIYQSVAPRVKNDVGQEMDAKLNGINARFTGQEETTSAIAADLAGLRQDLDKYNQALNGRITLIETSLQTKANQTDLDAGLTRIRQEAIDSANAETAKQIADIRKKIDDEIKRVDKDIKENETLTSDVNATVNRHDGEFIRLKEATDKIKELETATKEHTQKLAGVAQMDQVLDLFKKTNEGLGKLQKELGVLTADAITDLEARTTDRINELQSTLTLMEETQANLSNAINTMNEGFAGQLTDGLFDVDKGASTPSFPTIPTDSGKRRRGNTADTREAEALQRQKFTDLVKSLADAYMKQSDWNSKIQREVQRCVAEQIQVIKPDPDATPATTAGPMHTDPTLPTPAAAAQPPPPPPIDATQFDARLKQLEQLFLSTTGNPSLSPFKAPPPLPPLGNFDPNA